MRFAFVVLHYLDYEDTIECIESIYSLILSESEFDIVLVDNGSYNGTFEKINDKFAGHKNFYTILNERNLGFAQGNNVGYRYAKEIFQADFIVVLNSDTIILSKDFSNQLVETYKKTNAAVIGPDIVTLDGIHQNPIVSDFDKKSCKKLIFEAKVMYIFEALGINSLRRLRRKKNEEVYKAPKKSQYAPIHGAFVIFTPEFVKLADFAFYPNTFLYLEENILYYICKENNLKMYYEQSIHVKHKEDVSASILMRNDRKRMMFTFKHQRKSAIAFLELMNSSCDIQNINRLVES